MRAACPNNGAQKQLERKKKDGIVRTAIPNAPNHEISIDDEPVLMAVRNGSNTA